MLVSAGLISRSSPFARMLLQAVPCLWAGPPDRTVKAADAATSTPASSRATGPVGSTRSSTHRSGGADLLH